MTAPVFAEGGLCRCRTARGVFRIVELHLVRGEATCWGGSKGRLSFRTFNTSDLLPARRVDVAPSGGVAAPSRTGQR